MTHTVSGWALNSAHFVHPEEGLATKRQVASVVYADRVKLHIPHYVLPS